VWVDETHFLCWQGDHENPLLYARLADGRRIDGVVELEPEPAAPTSWAAKMIARRKSELILRFVVPVVGSLGTVGSHEVGYGSGNPLTATGGCLV